VVLCGAVLAYSCAAYTLDAGHMWARPRLSFSLWEGLRGPRIATRAPVRGTPEYPNGPPSVAGAASEGFTIRQSSCYMRLPLNTKAAFQPHG
jgi:hypothetical protein